MKAFLQTSTLLLGVSIFTFAQAHEVRSLADVFSGVERDAASLEARDDDSYGEKDYSGGSGWKGGSYEYKGYGSQGSDSGYDNGENAESTSTVIINITEEGGYGYGYDTSTVAAAGDQTSMMDTVTISAVSVQLSYVTTTVFESASAQTVTVTPMPQIITQTQMVTVTEAGTCSTTFGLATGAASTVTQSLVMNTASYSMVSAMSVTSVMSVPTSILTASPTSIGSPSVGSSGQVVQGTGVYNAVGACDCECFCAIGSFPSYSAMAASPSYAVPTTMQTMASSIGAQSIVSTSMLSTGTTSQYSVITSSSISSAYMAGTTMSTSVSMSSESESIYTSNNVVFTLNPSASCISCASSLPETATSSYTSAMSAAATATTASAQPDLAPDSGSATTMPSQAAASGYPINVSTLSLSSQLVLGNLAAQATPGA